MKTRSDCDKFLASRQPKQKKKLSKKMVKNIKCIENEKNISIMLKFYEFIGKKLTTFCSMMCIYNV